MDGKTESPTLDVEERHLDGGLGLEALRGLAIHEGKRAVKVEGISADENGGEPRDGAVDIGRGHERVARRGIDVAPPLAAAVRRDAHEHASLHGGRSVHTLNGALERYLDEDRRDGDDAQDRKSVV